MGLNKATGGMSLASEAMGALKGAAKGAAIEAGAMALEWAAASTEIAVGANRAANTFNETFGPAVESLADSVENLAGHMGLAEYEAQELLTMAGLLGQSMGMGAQESADFAAQMLQLSGDMAAFNPTVGKANDAMDAIIKASNGATRGMISWGISIKAAEVDARALAMTGKEVSGELTQQEKAMATLALITEKTANQQGTLNEKIADGSTGFRDATATIDDMQVTVGNALMPVRKLAVEGIKILAETLKALEPALMSIGELLAALFKVLEPLLPLINFIAQALAGALTIAVKTVTAILEPLIWAFERLVKWVDRGIRAMGDFLKKANPFSNFKFPSFHSGGVVPGAKGSLQPIMAQGGETIGRPGSGDGGGGGGTTINITVNAGISDPMDTARAISDLLTQYSQANGPLNIETR